MRTIVSLFVATLAVAQSPFDIEVLEKKIADQPDNVFDRVNLMGRLANTNVTLPSGQVRELRRQHILWLIEHHPEAKIYDLAQMLLPPRGRLADPDGSAQAVQLWKEIVSKPGVKPEVIANAAIYLRALDSPFVRALVDGHQGDGNDPALSRARGILDSSTFLGILPEIGPMAGNFLSSAALRSSPEAKRARDEIETSTDGLLVGAAGADLIRRMVSTPDELTFDDDDVVSLGERWLRRAIELAPPGTEWKSPLAGALQTIAGRTLDPTEKVRLLREARSLTADHPIAGILQALVMAEFDAGDDAAAESHAQELLKVAPNNAGIYNAVQTVLGRIAAAKGDLVEAKRRLMASVKMPAAIKNASFLPNMALAQDIYDAGDQGAVIEFLEASRSVWKNDQGRLDRMISFVKKAPSADLVQLSRQSPGDEMMRKPAPPFEAKDLDGKTWTREQLAGKVVALEFGNAPLAEKVAKDFAARGVVLVKTQDRDTKGLFEVLTDPTVVVIDQQGKISSYRSGASTEADWRRELESGFGQADPRSPSAPRQSEWIDVVHRSAVLSWEPVDNAASYVVEWDSRDQKGWIFDRDKTLLVIPTGDLSATLDLTGFTRIRWRVYAVPLRGPAGNPSPWMEIEGIAGTRSYR